MELYKNKENCCGCLGCFKVCPRNAIELIQDEKGFIYPKIIKEKCVSCGICQKVCPLKEKNTVKEEQVFMAIKNKDENIRKKSSSGGFFDAISNFIVDKGGYVFGAIYDKNLNVIHIGTNKKEELDKFKTSKYVQSDTKNTYNEVKELLKKNKLVLYSGTPCQIWGLKKYVKNIKEGQLITVDNVCHGVPSPGIFEKHREYLENKYKKKIKNINFRYKMNRGTQNLKIIFEDNTEAIRINSDDEYYRLFQSDYILRDSCYNCNFANLNRVSDITMADFWDFQDFLKEFDDKKGVSLIILNSKVGKEIFDKISENFEIKCAKEGECIQPNLKGPTKKPNDYLDFINDYKKYNYEKIIKKYPKYSAKIKIKKLVKKFLKKINVYKEK